MNPLDLVNLVPLMQLTSGKPEVAIGLIDAPVAIAHLELADATIREVNKTALEGSQASSFASDHGTLVAGILCGRRNSVAPAICPGCTLLLRPIFTQPTLSGATIPSATPDELSAAILDCLAAGADVLNLSVALEYLSSNGERQLEAALDLAASKGVIVVAAAGNQGGVGSSAIVRHPWVIPVVACDLHSRPTAYSNLGASIGRRGLTAPGQNIVSLSAGGTSSFSGTSVATPFVTGAIALLRSEFPDASSAEIRWAICDRNRRRATLVPPLLNAGEAYQFMARGLQSKSAARLMSRLDRGRSLERAPPK